MKTTILPNRKTVRRSALPGATGKIFMMIFTLMVLIGGCKKKESPPPTPVTHASYQQVNLVADSAGFAASKIDANLNNPWGIAIQPNGAFWISSNHKGLAVRYDRAGNTVMSPVAIPLNGVRNGASPDGVVFNSTFSFFIPATGQQSQMIFATEDGIITCWSSGDSTVKVADRSESGAVYKGIALGNDGTGDFVYATDFHNGKIDVFNGSFVRVTDKPFADASIPAGFAPFGIQNILGKLYVTYAKQIPPDRHDDMAGAGNGFVNIFNPDGTLFKRFASQGTLNSPWGVVLSPSGFNQSNAILVGNFGDGRINVFNADGSYVGQLSDGSNPISINGLWGLMFPDNGVPAGDPNQLFFTAGPDKEAHGLFGYLKLKM